MPPRLRFLAVLLPAASLAQSLTPQQFLQVVRAIPLPRPATAARALEGPAARIDPRLQRRLDLPAADSRARAIAPNSPAPLVTVEVACVRLADVAPVSALIREGGGEVTASFEHTIWARIGSDAIKALAASPRVALIAPQEADTPIPQEPSIRSERNMAEPADGVRAAHLDLLHRRGITGKGAKVGILDRGFARYSELVREGKVRPPRAQRAFPASHGVENGDAHGTACAEIVSAAAPGADLLLASFDGDHGNLKAAADWLISEGAGIISYSLGNVLTASDGSDEISRFIDETTRRYGVLWVIAAGNHAGQHWAGYSAVNREGTLEVSPGEYGMAVTALSNRLTIAVRWNNEGGPAQDIDAYLYALNDHGGLDEVARSTDSQSAGGSRPLEIIELSGNNIAGRQYFLVLRAGRLSRRVWLHVFLDPGGAGRLYPATAAGSILTPAAARSAIAVGAVDVRTGELTRYSSQGPTDDGRVKPEIAAPSGTISFVWPADSQRFPGTSAAAPHVAGFAALLKQMAPQATAAELRQTTIRSAAPRGQPLPNALYGFGTLDGSSAVASPKRDLVAGPIDGSVVIPEEFGDEISYTALSALRESANRPRDGLAVDVIGPADVYHKGDRLRVRLLANQDCACLLFLHETAGRWSLTPPEGSTILQLLAGQPQMEPAEESKAWRVTPPEGTDELMLVCASAPLPLKSVASGSVDSVSVALYSYLVLSALP